MRPSLLSNVTRFARGPRSRAIAGTTVRTARDPATRRQIEHVRARLAQRGRTGAPAAR